MALPVGLAAFAISHNPLYGLGATLGCLAGIPLTPDLDQEGISSSEYFIIKWTMGLGFFWTMIWFPYARACPHRSFASHFPVVSTALRLAYIGVFVAVAHYFGMPFPKNVDYWLASWIVGGLLVSDIVHWALDVKFGDPFDHKVHPQHSKVGHGH
jgi:uncharacterized metal-binding protein